MKMFNVCTCPASLWEIGNLNMNSKKRRYMDLKQGDVQSIYASSCQSHAGAD
ncbi:unnamed protein product [Staurois parvus]|uniref:Uncharacterized protein n=1 Tax=Staurois parvus TaxID=386267 RepID=A0ABN9C6S1_9NEOB|nr:unnamed protein product [Staurois parvus]